MPRAHLRPFVLVAALLVPLATGLGLATAQDATPTASDPEALARAFYEPFNTGDVSVYDRVLAEDWMDHPLVPGQAPGREGFKPIVLFFRSAIPDMQLVNEDILVDGDKVAVRSTFRGTHQGALFGIPPTGKPIEAMAIDIHRIENGQIVETWHVEDWLTVFAQLGVTYSVAPAAAATPTQ
jgi:steroid delta-isomerase-like uncharacterized protein